MCFRCFYTLKKKHLLAARGCCSRVSSSSVCNSHGSGGRVWAHLPLGTDAALPIAMPSWLSWPSSEVCIASRQLFWHLFGFGSFKLNYVFLFCSIGNWVGVWSLPSDRYRIWVLLSMCMCLFYPSSILVIFIWMLSYTWYNFP